MDEYRVSAFSGKATGPALLRKLDTGQLASKSKRADDVTQGLRPTGGADLQEGRRTRLLLENRQGLLQASDLSLAAALALRVRFRLRNAHRLELLPVLHDRVVLLHRGLLVLLQTRKHGLGLRRVLRLVLHG